MTPKRNNKMPAHQPLANRIEPARGSSLQTIKTQQRAKEEEEKIKLRRKKGVIVMMLQFLQEQGYGRSLDALQQESQVSLQKVAAADNIDLVTIFTQFEEYEEFRFGRTPKFFRNLTEAEQGSASSHHYDNNDGEKMLKRPSYSSPPPPPPSSGDLAASSNALGPQPPTHGNTTRAARHSTPPPLPTPTNGGALAPLNHGPAAEDESAIGGLTGKTLKIRRQGEGGDEAQTPDDQALWGRALKPMPRYPTAELQDLAMTIQRDILDANPNVSWSDIAELDHAKSLLKEAVVMPVKYPQLFQGIVRPWKGILLFGPPGTGKTMLAKALATECRSTFFNISASSIVSKWRGDSEKLVRMLFELAVHYAPSTIFIDELDALMSARASDGSEHEGSRRMKTELLVQMDGLQKRTVSGGGDVFVLAASNVPWDLDGAMLRRLEKRILVGLPSHSARKLLFQQLLTASSQPSSGPSAASGRSKPPVHPSTPQDPASAAASSSLLVDTDQCAAKTEGHSGADIDVVCREAVMRPIRKLILKLETEASLPNTPLQRPQVTTEDVLASIACTRSSGQSIPLKKYVEWEAQFGSGMSV